MDVMTRTCLLRPLWLLPIAFATACQRNTGAEDGFQVRDSSGVVLVESQLPFWQDGHRWLVDEAPSVSIGVVEGQPEYALDRVRDVVVTSDGRIVLSNEGTKEVRVFSSSGEWMSSIGGEGDGPGEFRSMWGLGLYRGDSLWVYDYANWRVSIFGPAPSYTFARHIPNGQDPRANYWVRGAFDNGSLILYSPGQSRVIEPPGLWDDSTLVIAVDPEGASVDTVLGMRVAVKVVDAEGRAMALDMSPRDMVAAIGDDLYLMDGETLGYQIYDQAGALRRQVRAVSHPEPVTSERKADYIDAYLAVLADAGMAADRLEELRRQKLASPAWAATVPPVSELVVDDLGYVWVGRYTPPGVAPNAWEVFDTTGRWLGSVATPERLSVKAISRDLIVGLYTDELGVQYVNGYRLMRQ